MSQISTISDPDNGIMFLDNYEQIRNPVNAKTPPPPMWGEILEEDLYDSSQPFYDDELAKIEMIARQKKLANLEKEHGDKFGQPGSRKLKRKVIYVYEKEYQGQEVNKPPPNLSKPILSS